METKVIEVTVSKETYEVGVVVGNLIGSIGDAMADGKFDMATELPTVIMTALAGIAPAIDKINQVPVEFKENPAMATQAMSVPLAEGIGKMLAGLAAGKVIRDAATAEAGTTPAV